MGLLSFVKGAGEKIFGGDDSDEKKEEAIEAHIEKYKLFDGKVTATVEGTTVTLSGEVNKEITKARLVTVAGNIEGVEKVDDQMTVTTPKAHKLVGESIDSDLENVVKSEQAVTPTETPIGTIAETEENAIRYYEVKSGDTLSAIALEMYGDASEYPKIFEANEPMLSDPDKIYPGQKLVIPA